MSKQRLGRGLDALIPRSATREISIDSKDLRFDDGQSVGVIAKIEISKIKPNPYQPRESFDRTSLEELKQSIIEKGVIQPITVRRLPGGMYELIAGERRVKASAEAGLTHIPAYIIEVESEKELLELALIENIQREKLNPIEIAKAYQRLIEELGYTQEEIAKKIGKDRTTVANFIRLLKLPEQIQESLKKGEITMGHARALINIPSRKLQIEIWNKIVKQGWSVRKVEKAVRDLLKGKDLEERAQKKKTHASAGLRDIESKLKRIFGTQVKIKQTGNSKGEIVIEFYSSDDFERLLELFEIIEKHSR
ncbi:chromosome partitioning protein, ParB family [Candidatus Kryptobacter tengchongensis]|uniref:Chromosome partitioning protein, ParB family n=1 Tax=Kryptobacter tengchongensis TaxID=1643429 RepID=A0A656D8K2_KRYT1|nr:ParB/RepB/Spo0J family partition protein [Candidatus Kryptobacter tengchongensis]CUT01200.1 chromosome partitioning protein, ParB family [Candidatus Kryptobacter tengchongensis]CUU10751.1 chromosome partitioning protein, ParB family [Candidatus Kryptobacter tengchongensis]